MYDRCALITTIIVLLIFLEFKRQLTAEACFHIGKSFRQKLRVVHNCIIRSIENIEINATDELFTALFNFLINIGGIFAILIIVEFRRHAHFIAQAYIFVLGTELAAKNALRQSKIKYHMVHIDFAKDVQLVLIRKVLDIADVSSCLFHGKSSLEILVLLYHIYTYFSIIYRNKNTEVSADLIDTALYHISRYIRSSG